MSPMDDEWLPIRTVMLSCSQTHFRHQVGSQGTPRRHRFSARVDGVQASILGQGLEWWRPGGAFQRRIEAAVAVVIRSWLHLVSREHRLECLVCSVLDLCNAYNNADKPGCRRTCRGNNDRSRRSGKWDQDPCRFERRQHQRDEPQCWRYPVARVSGGLGLLFFSLFVASLGASAERF